MSIKNTIIKNDGTTFSLFRGGASISDFTTEYSCYFNVDETSFTITGTGLVKADPLFVDQANGNFDLRPSSPCIAAGTST